MDSGGLAKPGTVIDGYRVGSRVHEGGMAAIYRVEPEQGGAACLLKLPKLSFGNPPACYAGFEVEQMRLLVSQRLPRLESPQTADGVRR